MQMSLDETIAHNGPGGRTIPPQDVWWQMIVDTYHKNW